MGELDTSLLMEDFDTGRPITLRFQYLSTDVLRSLEASLLRILSSRDLIFLFDPLATVIKEAVNNAVKANAKKIYLNKQGQDGGASTDSHLETGSFKEEVLNDISSIEEDLKEEGLYVDFCLQKAAAQIDFIITNNTAIRPEEYERISMRMAMINECDEFIEAYDKCFDETEGSGLGIILILFLLKNSGIGPETFKIFSDDQITRTTFSVALQPQSVEVTTSIKDKILNELELLPTFPAHITELIELCKDPDVSNQEIVKKVIVDPALTADMLKFANSAAIGARIKIKDINQALRTIGIRNFQEILISAGARRILKQRYPRLEEIWEHCNRTAGYASFLAGKYGLTAISKNVFLAGLLHDLGKIVLLSIDPNLTHKIADIVSNRGIKKSTLIEEVSIGISHSAIGAMMARTWHFPEYLVEAISLHHSPLNASPDSRDIVFVTYLANMICDIEQERFQMSCCEQEVLERFGLESEEQFNSLAEECREDYETRASS